MGRQKIKETSLFHKNIKKRGIYKVSEGVEVTDFNNSLKKLNPDLVELNNIMNCSPLPQFVIDREHRVVLWNKAMEDYSQIKSTDIVGTDHHWKVFYDSKRPCMVDLVINEDLEGLEYWFPHRCKPSQQVKGAYEAEQYYPHRGPQGTHLHFTVSTIRNHDGEIIGGFESFEDITKRKVAEKELQESEEKFRSLIENLNVGVYRNTSDPGGTFIQVNPAFAQIFGYDSPDEIMQINVMDLYVNKEDRVLFLEDLQREGSITDRKLLLKKKDYSNIWVSVSARAHYHEEGFIDWVDGMVEDTTHRIEAEEALQKSEKRYRSIVENINDGFCIHDFKGVIQDCNENFALMLGFGRDELIGTNLDEFSSTRMLSFKNDVVDELKNKGVVEFDGDVRGKNGIRHYYSINSSIISQEGEGKVQSFLRDVTKRKEMEKKLLKSENKAHKRLSEIEAIYNSAPMGLCVLDCDLRYLRINKSMAEMNGFSPQEHIGKSIHEMVPDLSQQGEAIAKEIFQTGKAVSMEMNGTTAAQDGAVRTWIEGWYPIKDSSHQIVGINVAALEITDIKRANEALKKSEEKLRLTIEGAGVIMWFWNIENDRVECRGHYKHILGPGPIPDMGYNELLSFVHPDDLEKVETAFQKTLQYGEDFKVETRTIWKDKSVHWFSIMGRVVYDLQGKPQEMIGIALDITNNKIVQLELQETLRKLKRSNAELEQFAYVASHDLKEPLRMVTSYLQLLEKKDRDNLDERSRGYLRFAVDGAKRMNDLIDDLLAYSRVGTNTMKMAPTDMNEIVDIVLGDLKSVIDENGADIAHDELPTIMADRTQMVQLFLNLVGNAIKFRGLAPPRVRVSAEVRGTEWVFSVQDNGIGIPKDQQDRLFQMFQRLHTREEYPGTGIGLAICKKIVERHGGNIWVESERGEGATFSFSMVRDSGM
jgi:PAS domain S-box-containing protein